MATAVKMPQLGMTMTEAKVVAWLKREGDPVKKGEPVANIETDKLNAEVEASADGVLRRIVASEGETVPVVGLMAVIGSVDEPDSAIDALIGVGAATANGTAKTNLPRAAQPVAPVAPAAVPPSTPAPPVSPTEPGGAAAAGDLRASPIAKRLAAEHGLDLTSIRGTGPGGRIVESDVRAAAERSPHPSPLPEGEGIESLPLGGEGMKPLRLGEAARGVGEGSLLSQGSASRGFIAASPIAKRLAREAGLDLHLVRATGPNGRVIERDVLAALQMRDALASAAAPTAGAARGATSEAALSGLTARETVRLEGIRRVVAARMHQSLQQMAQLTLTTEADATALVELRSHLVPAAKVYGHRAPTYTDLLISMVARILPQHPWLNASIAGEEGAQEVISWQEVNVGVAVALDRGLVVPVIRGADKKPLQAISQELADLAERARANRLSMDDLQGGTFTITNLGQQEIDGFTPIINPPQCAILGVGRIAKKPAVYQDQLAIRQMVTLSLSFDHRVVDGVPAGAFLRDVKRAIEAAALAE